jgi:hypothetical protein
MAGVALDRDQEDEVISARIPSAYETMVKAANARAVWDKSFPGFSANVDVNYEGQVHRGNIQVSPEAEVTLMELKPPDEQARSWALSWLGEMVFHRSGTDEFNHRYRGIRMVGSANHPLGPMLVTNDSANSSFRVDGKVIRQVNRDLNAEGTQRVRINVLDPASTPSGKVLPIQFVINYLDDQDRLIAIDAISSRFLRIEQYQLPQWRRVTTTEDGEMIAAEMTLSNHRLGKGVTVAVDKGGSAEAD